MKKDRLDVILSEGLKDEMKSIEMSDELKQRILNKALKKESIYEKLVRVMNTTIEIPITTAAFAAIFIMFMFSSSFIVTDKMKKDKTLYGVTSVKTINISGIYVLIDKSENEGVFYENN